MAAAARAQGLCTCSCATVPRKQRQFTAALCSLVQRPRQPATQLTDKVVPKIIAHEHILHLAELGALVEDIDEEVLERIRDRPLLVTRQASAGRHNGCHRVDVERFQTDRLGEEGLVVEAGATIAMSARALYVQEWLRGCRTVG